MAPRDLATYSSRSWGAARKRGRLRRIVGGDRAFAYLCLLPSLLLVIGIIVIPMVNVAVMAFSATDLIGVPVRFAGFANFSRLIQDPIFPQGLRQTLVWTVAMVVVASPISIALAMVLQRRFFGRAIARAVIFSP